MDISKSERAKKAMELFLSGYNCSQATFLAFNDLTGMDFKQAAKIASPFGGGMGRLREVCGSVSGMFLALGMLYGYPNNSTGKEKADLYKRVQFLAKRFKEENGRETIICRELLGLKTKGPDDPTPQKRTAEYYKKRPCKELVGLAAAVLEEYIANNPLDK